MKMLKTLCRPLAVLVLVLTPLAGCGYKALSWKQEIQMGNQAAPEFLEQGGGELPDAQVVSYVRGIGMRLVQAAQVETPDKSRPELEWEFHVLDSKVINAFALPGGKVFISRGLMEQMNNEAQLAGVIGHEIGHVTARHGNERVTQAIGLQVLIAGISIGADVTDSQWGQLLGIGTAAGGQLFLLKYSRDNELESDALGVKYMTRAGYNPVGQIQVMEILGKASGGGGTPEWLSTHPTSKTRIDKLNELIKQDYGQLINNPGHFTMGFETYKENILSPLKALPPAKHGSAMLSPKQFEKIAGMTLEQAMGQGCKCPKTH